MKSRFQKVKAGEVIKGDGFLCPHHGIWRQVDSVFTSDQGQTRIVYSLGLGGVTHDQEHSCVIRPRTQKKKA